MRSSTIIPLAAAVLPAVMARANGAVFQRGWGPEGGDGGDFGNGGFGGFGGDHASAGGRGGSDASASPRKDFLSQHPKASLDPVY